MYRSHCCLGFSNFRFIVSFLFFLLPPFLAEALPLQTPSFGEKVYGLNSAHAVILHKEEEEERMCVSGMTVDVYDGGMMDVGRHRLSVLS